MLPESTNEPVLDEICRSLDRVITAAHTSIVYNKVNVFDQTRITSFNSHPRYATRPLLVNLEKSTWKKYKTIWKRLLCFLVRTARPQQPLSLRHCLTTLQLVSLDRLLNQIQDLIQTQRQNHSRREEEQGLVAYQDRVDDACLTLCISVLDHDLRGDLYESVVTGFFAVLAIDVEKQILMEAYRYTPYLSAFVKNCADASGATCCTGSRER